MVIWQGGGELSDGEDTACHSDPTMTSAVAYLCNTYYWTIPVNTRPWSGEKGSSHFHQVHALCMQWVKGDL